MNGYLKKKKRHIINYFNSKNFEFNSFLWFYQQQQAHLLKCVMHTSCKISDRPNTFTGFIPDLLSILVKLSTWGNMTTGYPLKFLRHEATSRRSITTPSRCFPPLLPPSFLACPSPFPRTPNPLSLPFQMTAKQATWIQKDRTQLH